MGFQPNLKYQQKSTTIAAGYC